MSEVAENVPLTPVAPLLSEGQINAKDSSNTKSEERKCMLYIPQKRPPPPTFEIICSILYEVLANLVLQLLRAQQVER